MRLLMTEFDRPRVNLCGGQGVKIKLLTNSSVSQFLTFVKKDFFFCFSFALRPQRPYGQLYSIGDIHNRDGSGRPSRLSHSS